MTTRDCADRIRFSLSDKSGALRFEHFDIAEAPECAQTATVLRELLLGQPLAEIDVEGIRNMSCLGNGQCFQAVANAIEECQATFIRKR
jgi:hypothetical protein